MHPSLRLSAAAAALSLALAPSLLAQATHTPRTRPVTQAEVDRITRDSILIDTHNDVTSLTVKGFDIASADNT